MGFVNQNRKPPTQAEIEEYCERCEEVTVLSCSNWISSMLCFMTDEEIKDCLFAWLHYTQGDWTYTPVTKSAQMLVCSMRPVIRNNLIKQNKAIEDAKRGASVRWNKQQANKLNNNKLQCPPIATQCDTNAPLMPKIEIEIEKEIENIPPNPQTGANGGSWEFLFDRFNFWRDHEDGRNLAWHSTDPETMYICSCLKAETDGQKRAEMKRSLLENNEKHKKFVFCSWSEWCELWSMMQSVCKLNDDQVKVFGAVYNNNQNTRSAQILKQKAMDIATGLEVRNLFNFLTAAINR